MRAHRGEGHDGGLPDLGMRVGGRVGKRFGCQLGACCGQRPRESAIKVRARPIGLSAPAPPVAPAN
jgi:hypothetical protein